LEDEKKSMAHTQEENETLLQEEITTQSIEALTNKAAQIRERGKELKDTFHSLAEDFQGARTA
jgi:hypothetical protein